jgi:hypothetical protein
MSSTNKQGSMNHMQQIVSWTGLTAIRKHSAPHWCIFQSGTGMQHLAAAVFSSKVVGALVILGRVLLLLLACHLA